MRRKTMGVFSHHGIYSDILIRHVYAPEDIISGPHHLQDQIITTPLCFCWLDMPGVWTNAGKCSRNKQARSPETP
jgi:hypothetical protein